MQHSITFDTQADDGFDVATAVAYAYGYDSIEELISSTVEEVGEESEEEDTGDTA